MHSSTDPVTLGGTLDVDVTGLVLWLAADTSPKWQDSARTTPAVADADPVGAWDDLSGSGTNALQVTTGKRPLLKLAIQNNRPVVRFDGVDDFLSPGTVLRFAGVSQYTIKLVTIARTADASYRRLLSNETSSAQGWLVGVQSAGYDAQRGNGAGNEFVQGPSASVGAAVVLDAHYDGTTLSVAINGGAPVTAASARSIDVAAANPLGLGGMSNGASCANSDFAELLVYNRALSAAEHRMVERALGARWNVAVA